MMEEPNKQSRVAPATIRYIKLGPGGAWEAASLDGSRIDWGDSEDPHKGAKTDRSPDAAFTHT